MPLHPRWQAAESSPPRDACVARGIGFSAMISIDGVGIVLDDAVRGRPGNFERALKCIAILREGGVSLSLGCTITRTNAAYVDEILEWAIAEDLTIRFRVAEFIDRLYNGERGQVVRNLRPVNGLSSRSVLHPVGRAVRAQSGEKTYMCICGMLVEESPALLAALITTTLLSCRRSGNSCIARRSRRCWVTFGSHRGGRFSLAIWRSVGHSERTIATTAFMTTTSAQPSVRRCVFRREVSGAAAATTSIDDSARRTDCARAVGGRASRAAIRPRPDCRLVRDRDGRRQGDPLGGDRPPKASAAPAEADLCRSFYPFVSNWTCQEMALEGVQVVETYTGEFERAAREADEVVGGGPLMNFQSLDHMLFAIREAARRGAVARIEGCGIGPLHDSVYVDAVGQMFRLAKSSSASRCRLRQAGTSRIQYREPTRR